MCVGAQQQETLAVILGSSEKSYFLTNGSREEAGGVPRGVSGAEQVFTCFHDDGQAHHHTRAKAISETQDFFD